MIRITKKDLEDHLEEITSKLQSMTRPSASSSERNPGDIERFRNEHETTRQCLDICAEVLSHINGLRLLPVANGPVPRDDTPAGLSTQDLTRAHIMTLSALKDCCDELSDTLVRLRALEQQSENAIVTEKVVSGQGSSANPRHETQSLAKEFDSTRQCLTICSEASERVDSGKVHVLEDITIGKDGQQMLIASFGELFDARRVRIAEGAMQVVASSSSNASLQELFGAHYRRR